MSTNITPSSNEEVVSASPNPTPPHKKLSRRKMLTLAGSGTLILVAGGGVWRAADQGVFSGGQRGKTMRIGRKLTLVSLKVVHSLLYFSIEFCMGYLIYAGLKGREDRRTAIAASVVVGESSIFVGNRCRCPLTGLAKNLGATSGSVTDIYLPGFLASHLPLIHVPLLALALYLHVRNFLRRSRA
jgi:hypothetical protein